MPMVKMFGAEGGEVAFVQALAQFGFVGGGVENGGFEGVEVFDFKKKADPKARPKTKNF